ncbi:MAG: carbon-nitrogen hydrolase family protein [Pseudomonadota bacterium]|nr:carbon-nitrogen hydrolase family protein [Pseudomonadota bacterium]
MTDDTAKTLRVAALQYCAAGTADETLAQLIPMIGRAADTGAGLVCLPEAATFLAKSRESLQAEAEWEDDSRSLAMLADSATAHGLDLLVGSIFVRRRADSRIVNRAVLIGGDGHIRASYDKIHMFDADVGDGRRYRESDHFAVGNQLVLTESGGVGLGLTICYDLRFPHLYRALGRAGADVITVPAAFTFPSGRAHWHVLLRARAIETGSFIVAPAQCGTHADGRRTYGHAVIISPWGTVLAEAPTDDDNAEAGGNDAIIHANLDMNNVARARSAIPSLETDADFS